MKNHKLSFIDFPPSPDWIEEHLFFDGDAFFSDAIAAINSAENSIELESYIFSNDTLGEAVAAALCAAARRGVNVRVLVDGIGSPDWEARWGNDFRESGACCRTFHKLPWRSMWTEIGSSNRLEEGWLDRLRNLNRRNHRKLFLVDSKVAWVGSMNVSSVHLRSVMGEKTWRDTGLRVKGEAVELLSLAFERSWLPWRKRGGLRKKALWRYPSNVVRLNSSSRLRRRNYRDLVKRLRSAKERIWLTTPYFVPNGELLEALSAAAAQGADVRILVPILSDVFFMPWVTAAFVFGLTKAGARIYRYRPSVLHAKTLLIDDWATVGSSNFNHRSLFHDLEVDVVLTKGETRKQLADMFENDLALSDEFTEKDWTIFSSLTSHIGKILLLFRGWL